MANRTDLKLDQDGSSSTGEVFRYFCWVVILSIPLYVAGALLDRFRQELPIDLPVSALAAFVPMLTALILVSRQAGAGHARTFFKRALDYKRIKSLKWWIPALLLMPAVMVLEFQVLRWSGRQIHLPRISMVTTVLFILIFATGAIGEELGWQGYAFDRLHARWNALESALILGLIWALWHVIPFIQTRHSWQWVAWQSLTTVAFRIVIVWLYLNAGKSVLIAVVLHTMENVSVFLFPDYGSHYSPFVTFILLAGISGIAVIVWGPSTLTNFRFSRAGFSPK